MPKQARDSSKSRPIPEGEKTTQKLLEISPFRSLNCGSCCCYSTVRVISNEFAHYSCILAIPIIFSGKNSKKYIHPPVCYLWIFVIGVYMPVVTLVSSTAMSSVSKTRTLGKRLIIAS